ncbi:Prephenate dehydratase [Corchorus capsularis]|uniref:Prephenate dehydratase n=1 Tax=Corchorus capsularis TaxID=210143 RepID=A0A1R3GPP7_COCAP|nr:Prephenate dehydratase [Corchorus capsularis]
MATATSLVRSPTTSLSGKFTVSDQKPPTPPGQLPQYPTQHRRFTPLFASFHDDSSSNSGSKKNAPAVELEKLLDDAPYNVVSKDSPLHPRPLSSTQFSNSASDGSRLRVAYLGVRGAYSEAAAEKPYPNCEAVPCDQFDAAFEPEQLFHRKWLSISSEALAGTRARGGSRILDLQIEHELLSRNELGFLSRHSKKEDIFSLVIFAESGLPSFSASEVLNHPLPARSSHAQITQAVQK